MTRNILPLVLLSAMLCAAQSPNPVPMDKRYYLPSQTLEKMRSEQNVPAMREHAWRLFEGINQMVVPRFSMNLATVPIWITWETEDEVFPSTRQPLHTFFDTLSLLEQRFTRSNAVPESNNLRQMLLDMRRTQIPLSTVYFDPFTAQRMRTSTPALPGVSVTLTKTGSLKALDQEFTKRGISGAKREIAGFPDQSVAVKTAWLAVSATAWTFTSVPVWHGPPPVKNPAEALAPQLWPDAIRVDPTHARHRCSAQPPASCPGIYPQQPIAVSPAVTKLAPVPIDDFFYVPVCTCEEAAAVPVYPVLPGDYVVLVGMHIATREIPDWVWATFWWSDRPNEGLYQQNRPPKQQAPWNHYMMDTTLDMVTPQGPNHQPKAIYNPWLELVGFAAGKALSSNCMNCHRAAAYKNPHSVPPPGNVDPAGPELANKTKLDFLWSIDVHADTALQQQLQLLLQQSKQLSLPPKNKQ